tara:strand:- start:1600 stop:1986 length:387 start_codon:yes stop_codon:yes gene_type:complete
MENKITLKNEYNILDKLMDFLKGENSYESSLTYDIWGLRTDANGQMEKCVLVKKSSMHGMKVYFSQENELMMSYVIPNKVMNAYFGKSVKARKSILEVIGGGIKNVMLSGSQNKAFQGMESIFKKIAA